MKTGSARGARTGKAKSTGQVPGNRQAIFDTAERLCGELGLEAVSVRDIAAAAEVNLGAINYYFGSRMNLLVEILHVRGAELAAERERLLAEVRAQDAPSVRAILHAVMAPLAQWRRKGSNRRAALMFLSRALTAAQPELKREVDGGVLSFRGCIDLLQRALPQLNRAEICWRFHFTMSIEHMNAWDEERLQILSGGLCKADDHDEALERALDFAVTGFMASPRGTEGTRKR